MGKILALDLDGSVSEEVRSRLTAVDGVILESTTKTAGLRLLDADPSSVELLVVGGSVTDPIQTAQRAFAAKPQLPVLILISAERNKEVRNALLFAPLIGEHVRCVLFDEASSTARTIEDTVARARQRARHASTVSALNENLAAKTTARAPMPAVELLGRIMQRAPIGVVVIDRRGIITALNSCGARLLDTNEQSSIGTLLPTLFAPGETHRWVAFLDQLSRPDGDALERFAGASASARQFEVTGAPLTGRDGAPGYVVLLQDVTERAQLVERERQARQQAEAASRTKDEFLAMLGHELRNPLSPIVTALQLMRLRGTDVRVAREQEIIERQVQHLVRLVDDLLDISRITRGQVDLKKERCDVAAVIAEAIEQARPLLDQRSHRLAASVPVGQLAVDGDPLRLAQVICNLLTNAAKYTEAGGLIEVSAARVDGDIQIRVRDNGIGIAPEMLPRVFDSFVQGERGIDRSLGGLGLGLAIVRNLISMHGGAVRAASAGLGRGSEFVVRLPAATDDGGAATIASARTPAVPLATKSKRLRVLLVDDNTDAAELLAVYLDGDGYEVRVAYDGAAALREAAAFAPDACVLDIGLPGMDGYELARRLHAEPSTKDAALIALTGYGQASDRHRSLEAGFKEHLVKPVNIEQLRTVLEGLSAAR